jgi:FtsP/CotA-like multicopper oxidase with cupredoxin domain
MIIHTYDYFVITWLVIAVLCTCYVAIDQFTNNPEPSVMRWGFILITLYMGPIGLLLYVLADKEPQPGTHEQFTAALWKQAVGSTIHCCAGDATGIILAAAITALIGFAMWIDVLVEYVAGFSFGLFIFQSLFMMRVMGGSYWANVRNTFVPELISMNAMMAAMAPVMSFLMMGRDMRAMDPFEPMFWFVMSLGVIAGFVFAYPFNVWMIRRGLKHGLMTERPPGSRFDVRKKSHHGHSDRHAGRVGHRAHAMRSDATRPQLAAVAAFTTLMLAAGIVAPTFFVNMRLGAKDIAGLVMPPGMIMDRNTSADAMRDMSYADPRRATARYDLAARGDQELPFRLDGGTKVFELTAAPIRWTILPDVTVDAYAYNGQIPGPRIHIRQGDHVRIEVRNALPEQTTVHWHGLILPNQMDGPAEITQDPIPPGGLYIYEFTATQHGTYFYHPHAKPDRTQALGLYGALIIDPSNPADELKADHEYVIQLQEWLRRDGLTFPAMPMDGMQPNYFTINGKAYPATETIPMKLGETLKVRFIGTNNGFIHPMHIHGGPFEVVARDGEAIPPAARFLADTVNVGPGQRYDVIWKARERGKWLIHCHIPHHTSNDHAEVKGGGGLMVVIDVQ